MMLKEEYRTHTTYSGKGRFLTFPFFVFFLSFSFAITLDKTLETMSLADLATFTHLSAFAYGLSVGTFGLMGRQYLERRYGTSNYLVAMPYLLPLSFRTTFLGIFLRDAIFYVLLLLVPATLGLLASAPIMGFSVVSIFLFLVAATLSFMLGMSLSFLASVLFIRSTKVFLAFTAVLLALFSAQAVFQYPGFETLLPSLGFQMHVRPFAVDAEAAMLGILVALLLTSAMTALSFYLVEVRVSISSQSYPQKLPEYHSRIPIFSGLTLSLISKEMVDLRRSGTVPKMFFSFVLPMLFLSLTVWFVNYGLAIPVGFNAVFYAAMVGFVGTLMYNWLNNIDLSEYYSFLPVTVPQLIKVRIRVFLLLTIGISAFFVVAISILNGETELLWLALVVMFVTSLYMVVVMAYLTGLKTNTFLFDTSVLAKFAVLSFLPDVCLTILSFSLLSDWVAASLGIALVLGSMLVATRIMYKGIEARWAKAAFAS